MIRGKVLDWEEISEEYFNDIKELYKRELKFIVITEIDYYSLDNFTNLILKRDGNKHFINKN